jgi:hypothetical protein
MNDIIQTMAMVITIVAAVITVGFAIKSVNTYRKGRRLEALMARIVAPMTDEDKVYFTLKICALGYHGPMPWLADVDIEKAVNNAVTITVKE